MISKSKLRLLYFLILLTFPVSNIAQIINGANLLFSENQNLIAGKNIGVVCNHTSLLKDGTHLVDALIEHEDVEVKAIFTPEHGFKGSAEAGEKVDYKNDLYNEVPIISLYSKDRKHILAVNGEIYNFPELRKQTESSYEFQTHSDCEVILKLFLKLGDVISSRI